MAATRAGDTRALASLAMTDSSQKTAVAAGPETSTATRETLEDYTLRFAPRHYRRWSTGVVAGTMCCRHCLPTRVAA